MRVGTKRFRLPLRRARDLSFRLKYGCARDDANEVWLHNESPLKAGLSTSLASLRSVEMTDFF
jgi:hypothetical protein